MPNQFRLADYDLVAFVTASSAERARKFYGQVLQLPLVSDELPFALVYDAHGTMLRVTILKKMNVAAYTVLGWNVPDVKAAAATLNDAGVQFERYEGMAQDDLGIWSSPSGSRVAWFKDLDGNTLSISQH